MKTLIFIGRSERIRTSDPHNPIVVRYQAALRSVRARILGLEATYVNVYETLPFENV